MRRIPFTTGLDDSNEIELVGELVKEEKVQDEVDAEITQTKMPNVEVPQDEVPQDEIDELFERWEHKITNYEDLSRAAVPTDELVEEFTNQEEHEELTQELNALLAQR